MLAGNSPETITLPDASHTDMDSPSDLFGIIYSEDELEQHLPCIGERKLYLAIFKDAFACLFKSHHRSDAVDWFEGKHSKGHEPRISFKQFLEVFPLSPTRLKKLQDAVNGLYSTSIPIRCGPRTTRK